MILAPLYGDRKDSYDDIKLYSSGSSAFGLGLKSESESSIITPLSLLKIILSTLQSGGVSQVPEIIEGFKRYSKN